MNKSKIIDELLGIKSLLSIDISSLEDSLIELQNNNSVKSLSFSLITIINRCEELNNYGDLKITNLCLKKAEDLHRKLIGRDITRAQVSKEEVSIFNEDSKDIIITLKNLIKEINKKLKNKN